MVKTQNSGMRPVGLVCASSPVAPRSSQEANRRPLYAIATASAQDAFLSAPVKGCISSSRPSTRWESDIPGPANRRVWRLCQDGPKLGITRPPSEAMASIEAAPDQATAFSMAMASWVSPSSRVDAETPRYAGVTGLNDRPLRRDRNACCLSLLPVASKIGVTLGVFISVDG